MEVRVGDLLQEGVLERDPNCKIAIPANGVLNAGGKLVMGAGFAKDVSSQYIALPEIAGMTIRDVIDKEGFYGFAFITGSRFALFQSKRHFKNKSSLKLIEKSVKKMLDVVEKKRVITDFGHRMKSTGKVQFSQLHIPMPGIGLGGLDREDVENLLYSLLKDDDRFVFWVKPV